VAGNSRTVRRAAYWLSLAFVWIHLFGLSTGALAETFRWQDETGRTHYADSLHGVPEEYRSQAEEVSKSLRKPIRVFSSSNPKSEESAPLNWNEFEEALREEAAKEDAEEEDGVDAEQETVIPDFDFLFPEGEGEGKKRKREEMEKGEEREEKGERKLV